MRHIGMERVEEAGKSAQGSHYQILIVFLASDKQAKEGSWLSPEH